MASIEENVCEAIDIILTKAISEATYDKTVQATIVSCIDESLGKYKVKYQDSTFYAYAVDTDVRYSAGTSVYVLIPGNDMTQDKTILGTTKALGTSYVATAEGDAAYEVVGKSVLTTSQTTGLCSYVEIKEEPFLILYSKDSSNNIVDVDTTAVSEYIANSGYIICGGKVRTALPTEQQYRGNYGMIFALDFLDNTENQIVTRYYIVDVDTMVGNPYKLIYDTRQYGIFEIDGDNFIEINYIALFDYSFPHLREGEPDDIFISDLELSGANRLSDDDLNNYSLTLLTAKGTFFKDSLDSDTLTIEGQVRVQGKVVNSETQSLSFYWGIQDVSVSAQSQYYCKNLGQGWKCLNSYNIIEPADGSEDAVVEWVPASSIWTVTKTDVPTQEIQYKCAVVYDSTVIAKTLTIKNFDANYAIEITSDQGTQFYYDNGYPTLTCSVYNNGIEQSADEYTYTWAETNSAGTFISMPETEELYDEYVSDCELYNNLLSDLEAENVYANAVASELAAYKALVDAFKTVTMVKSNIVYHINVNTITNFSTYQCTVYKNQNYIGTASIVLLNTLSTEGTYSLLINNGTYAYKYDSSGLSPACDAVDSPIDIKALTFTIYDNLGQPIDDEIARHCDIAWTVPTSDTLLSIPDGYEYVDEDEEAQTKTYHNVMSLTYEIAKRYDISKTRNDIYLTVNYKDEGLSAKTNLTFVKEGESGTNGTEYTCKIVPNVDNNEDVTIPQYLIITQRANGAIDYNYTHSRTATSGQYLKVQLYHNENLVFDQVNSGVESNDDTNETITVTWSMLANTYSSRKYYDSSSLSITENGILTYNGYDLDYEDECPAHIIKATVERAGITYYATFPVITVRLFDDSYTAVELKEGTGFLFATYTSDGLSPQYDNANPFELIVTRTIDNIEEDVSTLQGNAQKLEYDWHKLGRIYYNSQWFYDDYLLDRRVAETLSDNQCALKPVDEYDGQCVTVALECYITHSGTEVARIHIPIHLMLNRYGLASLNGWDGNSIQISEEGGFILAPQVGAGIKNEDNSFTGVVIGKVQESNMSTADVGVVGYHKGERSIFLDSETGKSVFGTVDRGQITIDPGSGENGDSGTAKIYSGDYFIDNDPTGQPNGTGMLIDLNKPEIMWGNGNFTVDSNGYITAQGGGTIAGWAIDNQSFYTADKEDTDSVILSAVNIGDNGGRKTVNNQNDEQLRILVNNNFGVNAEGHMYAATGTIGSGSAKITLGKDSGGNNSAIYSQKSALTENTTEGFYLGTDGIALGGRKNYDGTDCSAFQVSSDGEMVASSGYIGGRSKGWTIVDTALYNSKDGFKSDETGVYIGTDGIALGKTSTDDSGDTFSSFEVDSAGKLIAASGYIGNKRNGWTIGTKSLYNGQSSYNPSSESSEEGVYIGTDGIGLGAGNFYVTKAGKLTSVSGTIGGWTIGSTYLENSNNNGSITLNASEGSITGTGKDSSTWSINRDGTATFDSIKANGGAIGGWTIDGNDLYASSSSALSYIYGGNIKKGATNSSSSGWWICSDGTARFNSITFGDGTSIDSSNSLQQTVNTYITNSVDYDSLFGKNGILYNNSSFYLNKYEYNVQHCVLLYYLDGKWFNINGSEFWGITSIDYGSAYVLARNS